MHGLDEIIAGTQVATIQSLPPPTPTTLAQVIVVILNWNNLGLTQDTLRSLQEQDYPNLSTVVIDNASRNQQEVFAVIKDDFPKVELWGSKRNLGFALGCNLGMNIALERGAEFILLLNNDVLLEPGAISRLVASLEADEGAAAAGPVIVYASDPERVWFAGGHVQMGGRVLPEHLWLDEPVTDVPDIRDCETEWLAGTCILVRRSAVERAGMMDPAYFLYWEDVDWSFRLRAAGYYLLLVPEARVLHRVNASTNTLPSMGTIYYWERNRLRFIEKWGTLRSRLYAWSKIAWRSLAWRVRLPPDDSQAPTKLEAYRDYMLGRFGPRRTSR